ncbi:unnamed protein product [Heligmosomoides polygyrus]|uniref:Acyl_transf_3 domain-containing protein n=1 Tax=Heligmosomoides polygyrus TaxID=6339 RepID=A0A183GBS4_HELPZ|nr:unnamed protein product [Heligmosomoides polygyrus]
MKSPSQRQARSFSQLPLPLTPLLCATKSLPSAPVRFFLAFSFYTNAALLLDTRPPKEGTLRSLSSIRFLSMTWVVFEISDTMRPVLSLWNSLLSTTFTNAFLSVDTFFLLSGVLVSYLFFKAPPSSRFVRSPFTWTLFYVHRYLRLTPPLMMFIGLYTVLLPFTNGPWTASVALGQGGIKSSVEACQKYWWRNMLYINNLFGNSAVCFPFLVHTRLKCFQPEFQ